MNAGIEAAPATGDAANRPRYELLDALRGVAALAVAVLHGCQIFGLRYVPTHANLAVDFFFCLSGFVVAYSYHERLRGGMGWGAFARKRLIRLYPLIFLGVLVGAAVTVGKVWSSQTITGEQFAVIFLSSFLLLPGGLLYGMAAYPLNNPMWSLFFEFVANFVYGWWVRLPRAVLALLTLACGAWLAWAIFAVGGLGEIGFKTHTFLYGLPRVGYPFFCGVLLFTTGLYRRPLVRLGRLPILIVLAAMLFNPLWPVSPVHDAIMVLVAIPLLVTLSVHAHGVEREPAFVVLIGTLSYPFYIVHQPIVRGAKIVFDRAHAPLGSEPLAIAAALLAAAVFGYLALKLFDEPVRRRLSRPSRRRDCAVPGIIDRTERQA